MPLRRALKVQVEQTSLQLREVPRHLRRQLLMETRKDVSQNLQRIEENKENNTCLVLVGVLSVVPVVLLLVRTRRRTTNTSIIITTV